MRNKKVKILIFAFVSLALLAASELIDRNLLFLLVPPVFAHCDTMGGPVIKAAKKALETGNVNLVLIWVQPKDEDVVKAAFQKTLSVRELNPEAKELADMYFFETLVRIHRAGEGAPYEGLKPAGTEEPPIAAADIAVESGQVSGLVKEMSTRVSEGIKEHFNELLEKKKNMGKSVEAGREYVASYITFVHYVEKLYVDAAGRTGPAHIH